MSDPVVGPEPLAVEPLPVEPLPVEPLAAEPVAVEAVPVQAVAVELLPDDPPPQPAWPAYDPPPLRRGPPGGVATLGVCSIIVAAICLIGGGITTLSQMMAYAVSAATAGIANVGVNQQRTTAAAITNGPPEVVGVGGMAAADRATVIAALTRAQPLSPVRQGHVDELLATDGKAVMPTSGTPTPEVVAAMLTGSGRLASLGTSTAPPTFFNTTNGRLVVGDDQAVFYPADGQKPITATAYAIPPAPVDAAPPLSETALRSVLRAITAKGAVRPSAAQVDGIVALLRMPTQQVIVPTGTGVDPAAEVTNVTTDDGPLVIETQHGTATCTLTVQPDGQVAAQTGSANASKVPVPQPGSVRGVMWTGLAQAAVAVYLLIAGILTVRQHRRGGQLHWAYVGVKLPAAVGAILAAQWLWPTLFAARGGPSMALSPWTWPALIGLGYPLAVGVLLLTPSVRGYYKAVS